MRESVRRRLMWVGLLVLGIGLLSACSIGSDDADPTSTAQSAPSVTTEPSPSPSATATSTTPATPPPPTSTPEPPTPTSTSTPRPTTTATPIPKVPLGNITPLNPAVLTNYSLSAEIELRGVPSQTDFVMSLLVLQAAPDRYYLRSTSGSSSLESWLVDGTTYLTQADGSVAELPVGSDTALFSPALLVQTVPAISGETLGVQLGVEDVGGRQATHYRIEGSDLLASTSWLPGDDASDAEGQVEIWIDNELGIILREEADVRWDNADGSEGSFTGRYEVTNVSTTEPVTAPG